MVDIVLIAFGQWKRSAFPLVERAHDALHQPAIRPICRQFAFGSSRGLPSFYRYLPDRVPDKTDSGGAVDRCGRSSKAGSRSRSCRFPSPCQQRSQNGASGRQTSWMARSTCFFSSDLLTGSVKDVIGLPAQAGVAKERHQTKRGLDWYTRYYEVSVIALSN